MEGSVGVRFLLDFRMIFVFNLMVYFDFFKIFRDYFMFLGRKKEEMKL